MIVFVISFQRTVEPARSNHGIRPLCKIILICLYLFILRLFVPKNRDEEILLLLLISESIVSQDLFHQSDALPHQHYTAVPQTTDLQLCTGIQYSAARVY